MLPPKSNFEVLREPRGLMKFIQIVFAICAFATTCDFTTNEHFILQCKSNLTINAKYNFSYPFRVNENKIDVCNSPNTTEQPKNLYGDFSSSAQFFVFTGVIIFLYSIAVVMLYVFWGAAYENDGRASQMDFVISIGVAVFWFIASAAWSDGVQQFKSCVTPLAIKVQANAEKFQVEYGPTFGGLNASLIFGFANILLWASGLWFIWKETSWAKRNDSLMEPNNVAAADGSSI